MNNFPSISDREFGITDLLDVISIILGYENLIENRQQSAHNDVEKANSEQTERLLVELGKKFDSLNNLLEQILNIVKVRDERDRKSVV